MAQSSSYNVSSFAVDQDREIERLQAQVDLFWPQELLLYKGLGLQDNMRLLDCGCGPGYLVSKLKEQFPGLVCTGVDLEEDLVALATTRNGGRADCGFLRGTVTALDFADNTFDFVIARLLIEHLPGPSQGLNEIWRVLKPGGTAVIVDNDFALHEQTFPACPSLSALYDAYQRARRADGGNPCIGRELPTLLTAAGFEQVALQLLAAHNQITGDEAFLRAEGSGIPAQLVRTGFLASETLDAVALEWMRMLQTPGHAIFRMLFAASGRKPSESVGTISRPASAQTPAVASNSSVAPGIGVSRVDAGQIETLIRNTLALELGGDPNDLDAGEPMVHLGVDSIAALQLCNRLRTQFSVSFSVAEVLGGASIADLASLVLERVGDQAGNPAQFIASQPRSQAKGG